ncbi:MAG: hydantoinase/oxoprolinase family protein [bacterium]
MRYFSVYEVNERIDAHGNILIPLDREQVLAILHQIKKEGITAVSIALLNSYKNNTHEQIIKAMLKENGFTYVSSSEECEPSIKIVPRAHTVVVNSYLLPVFHDYLSNIRHSLGQGSSLKVMTSAGGLIDADSYYPKDSLLSGPSGGVVGSAIISRQVNLQKLLTLDMGGTSTDVSRYEGCYDYRYELKVGGATIFGPFLYIETVAAGGGSICFFDGMKFSVGPESAGAQPSPACYGAGGPLTITDVNLLLGRLHPERFGIPISKQAALERVEEMKRRSPKIAHMSHEKLLNGFMDIAHEKLAGAIHKISISKYEPFALSQYSILHKCHPHHIG